MKYLAIIAAVIVVLAILAVGLVAAGELVHLSTTPAFDANQKLALIVGGALAAIAGIIGGVKVMVAATYAIERR